jgi:hypothetical protein
VIYYQDGLRRNVIDMKHILNLLVYLFLIVSASGQEPLSKDTLICLVDTTKPYVEFWGDTIASEAHPPWVVQIHGRYYEHLPDGEDFGSITFSFGFWDKEKIDKEGYALEKIHKEKISKRFSIKNDEWLNSQTSLDSLKNTISFAPFDKYNFVIFYQDFINEECDSVVMYRVIVSYNEIQY